MNNKTIISNIEELKEIEKMKNDNFGFVNESIKSHIDFKKEFDILNKQLSKSTHKIPKNKERIKINKYFNKVKFKNNLIKLKNNKLIYIFKIMDKYNENNILYFQRYYIGTRKKFFKRVSSKKIRKNNRNLCRFDFDKNTIKHNGFQHKKFTHFTWNID